MTETEFDESLIGPLRVGGIGSEPQSWGPVLRFLVADPDVEREVEQQLEHKRRVARSILDNELRALVSELREGSEPHSVLHGLLAWGPISVPALAGYAGLTVTGVKSSLDALGLFGIVILTGTRDEMGAREFEVEPDALRVQDIFS